MCIRDRRYTACLNSNSSRNFDDLGVLDSQLSIASLFKWVKVKFFHTRYRALGPDPGVQAVSPQVTSSHPPGGRLSLLSARPAFTSMVFTRWRHMVAHIRFQLTTQWSTSKGWKAELAWLAERFIHNSDHPSAAGRDGLRRPETDVLPLCHATNLKLS